MDEYQKIIDKLHSPRRRVKNYDELSSQYVKQIEAFEMKVYSAPLIGCGAGLILFASALKSANIPNAVYAGLLPGIWCFFIGVSAAIVGGVFYIFNMSAWKDEQIIKSSAQNSFLSLYDNFSKYRLTEQFRELREFPKHTVAEFDHIISLSKKAELYSIKGQYWLTRARWLIVASGILFFIGVLLPLGFITFGSNFLWQ
ncbi:hypothetical protein N9W89_00695 [Hellea sp.]|nr:hypothetical protein [Hellea sp.]